MRHRHDTAVLLDEDEQQAIIDGFRHQSKLINWVSRRLVALIECAGVCYVSYSWLSLVILERPRVPGEANGLAHHVYLTSQSIPLLRQRLATSYGCTVIALACALLVCVCEKLPFWARHLGALAACGPPVICGPMLFRVGAPLTTWWIALTAPLGLSLAYYINSDMLALARGVADLDDLRYKYKKV